MSFQIPAQNTNTDLHRNYFGSNVNTGCQFVCHNTTENDHTN